MTIKDLPVGTKVMIAGREWTIIRHYKDGTVRLESPIEEETK